ncbi:cobalamin binding intrinsic factor-like [Mobula birostris]|uniref:cobalamin binding intrinsic factor-like n=1 Tax=Mobula birostris TaxID=1983395 RepID=UPI003B287D7F
MLALCVLRASCVNPANVTSDTSSVNLVSLLEEKLAAEMKSIVTHHHPVTTYYQVALALLGLCQQGSPVRQTDVRTFSAAVMNGELKQGNTEAVSALALRCFYQGRYKPADSVRDALIKLTMELYCARTDQHTIGNLYSTGLTAQALIANEYFIPAPVWGAKEILEELRAQAEPGAFVLPVFASQALPALLWTSYLDAGRIPCRASVPPGSGGDLGKLHRDANCELDGQLLPLRPRELDHPGRDEEAESKEPEYVR